MDADAKARFRAYRELVGMSQAELAQELGVQERSVRRWEAAGRANMPPEDAWEVLESALARQRLMVTDTLDRLEDAAETEGAPESVTVSYWHSAEQYAKAHGTEGTYRMANATARALASALDADGFDVDFSDGRNLDPQVTLVY